VVSIATATKIAGCRLSPIQLRRPDNCHIRTQVSTISLHHCPSPMRRLSRRRSIHSVASWISQRLMHKAMNRKKTSSGTVFSVFAQKETSTTVCKRNPASIPSIGNPQCAGNVAQREHGAAVTTVRSLFPPLGFPLRPAFSDLRRNLGTLFAQASALCSGVPKADSLRNMVYSSSPFAAFSSLVKSR
jgi:hypothetical protein